MNKKPKFSIAQARVLVEMLYQPLLRCDHVCLEDGVSYFFATSAFGRTRVSGSTVHVLWQMGMLRVKKSRRSLSYNYVLSTKGRGVANGLTAREKGQP